MRERYLQIVDPIERENLATFVGKAVRLDEATVIRLRERPDGRVGAWATTGFDALAVRVIAADLRPTDTTAGGDALLQGLEASTGGQVELGYSMDSAWKGALPPDNGFVHIDDVPAAALVELAQRGAALAKEHGSTHGPPTSLLDQEVLEVHGGDDRLAITMRTVFALTAMGFIPDLIEPSELVRVRASRSWIRLDARYGSVAKHRTGGLGLRPL